MFRFEVGAKILVRRYDWYDEDETIEVEILAKAPTQIKAKVLSDGWFRVGEIHWLSDKGWFPIGRSKN